MVIQFPFGQNPPSPGVQTCESFILHDDHLLTKGQHDLKSPSKIINFWALGIQSVKQRTSACASQQN